MKVILFLLIITATVGCNKKAAEVAQQPSPPRTTKEIQAEKRKALLEKKVEMDTTAQKAHVASPKMWFELGYQKHNAGDFTGAIADFSKSIELYPQYAEAYNFRGISKYKSGDTNGACADWKKALELQHSASSEMIRKYCQ